MNIYIWEDVNGLTDNYHDRGGLVVVAETLDAARNLAQAELDREWGAQQPILSDPTAVYELVGVVEPRVWVFPDAGCC